MPEYLWGFYFHIPFCVQKCSYCDFYSYPAAEEHIQQYTSFLEKEVSLLAQEKIMQNGLIDSIYFGGGTPSLIGAQQYENLLTVIKKLFPVSQEAEITLEVNPGITQSPVKEYIQAGINRLSVGVQSFNQRFLELLQRPYSAETLLSFFDSLSSREKFSLSLDLLYGIPSQMHHDLLKDLQYMFEIYPEHVSYYQLTRYKGTRYDTLLKEKKLVPPGETDILDQEKTIEKMLGSRGYSRYEVSNYCRNHYISRHNMKYWLLKPYYGFGEGSSSLYDNIGTENACGKKYYRLLQEGRLPVENRICYSPEQMLQNKLVMGLRLTDGIPWQEVEILIESLDDKKKYYKQKIEEYQSADILQVKNGLIKVNSALSSVLDSILLEFI